MYPAVRVLTPQVEDPAYGILARVAEGYDLLPRHAAEPWGCGAPWYGQLLQLGKPCLEAVPPGTVDLWQGTVPTQIVHLGVPAFLWKNFSLEEAAGEHRWCREI